MMVIDNKHKLGDIVYLKTDADQAQRIVTCLNVRLTGIVYELSCGVNTSFHYEFEISDEVNEVIKVR